MLKFLSKFFVVKQFEIEAKLVPTTVCTFGGVGEVELEGWSDGTVNLEASLKHTGLPDNAQVDVHFGGKHVLTLQVASGYARESMQIRAVHTIPAINVGDIAEMRFEDQILYRGQFRPD